MEIPTITPNLLAAPLAPTTNPWRARHHGTCCLCEGSELAASISDVADPIHLVPKIVEPKQKQIDVPSQFSPQDWRQNDRSYRGKKTKVLLTGNQSRRVPNQEFFTLSGLQGLAKISCKPYSDGALISGIGKSSILEKVLKVAFR